MKKLLCFVILIFSSNAYTANTISSYNPVDMDEKNLYLAKESDPVTRGKPDPITRAKPDPIVPDETRGIPTYRWEGGRGKYCYIYDDGTVESCP